MGQRPLVLGELTGAERLDVLDPLDRLAAHVSREALVAEDRQAFLQAQLEPVAAGDAVAGPVVEVLVGDDALDALIVQVGGRGRIGEQQGGVEDVQPLVLHGAEIEVAHGDDHEQVEVVFPAERLLVPLHRALQGVHGVGRATGHARIHIDLQVDGAAAHGDKRVGQLVEFAGHQGEQVAGLGERVVPDGEALAAGQVAGLHQIAVGEQPLVGLRRLDPHREAAQHVGTVGEPGDLAEALGLALGTEMVPGFIQTFQRLVVLGSDPGDDLQCERCRNVGDSQGFIGDPVLSGR
ncbi:hypothetical protein GALL_533310 [mine drainage metagenome]|uniref:Uncharacterized protein n=1 Tax=mine drainage metagenome TaxID=410659 RepID=A0A1J5P0P5_9ZZZZ